MHGGGSGDLGQPLWERVGAVLKRLKTEPATPPVGAHLKDTILKTWSVSPCSGQHYPWRLRGRGGGMWRFWSSTVRVRGTAAVVHAGNPKRSHCSHTGSSEVLEVLVRLAVIISQCAYVSNARSDTSNTHKVYLSVMPQESWGEKKTDRGREQIAHRKRPRNGSSTRGKMPTVTDDK